MKPVVIHTDAELELWQAVSFYENKVSGLGLDFETETGRILAEIQETPKRYPKVKHGARPYYWLGRTKEQLPDSLTEQRTPDE